MDSYVPLSHFHTLSQAQVTEQMDKVSVDWDAALEMMRLAPMPALSSPRIDSLIDEFAETMAFVNSLPEPEQQSAAQGPGNDPNVAMGMMQPGLQLDFFSAAVGQPHQTVQPFMAAEASFPAENADPFGMGFQQPDFSAAQLQLPAQQPAMAAPAPYFPPFVPELPMDAQAAAFSAGQPIAPAVQPSVAQPSFVVKYAEMDGPTRRFYEASIEQMLRDDHGFKPKRDRTNATKVRIEAVELLAAGQIKALNAKLARFAYKAKNQAEHREKKKSAKKGSASPSTPSSAASSAS